MTAPSEEPWPLRLGTFPARASCPHHPGARVDRFGSLGRCSDCSEAIPLCCATMGSKECVLAEHHAGRHCSPSGSSWGAPGEAPSEDGDGPMFEDDDGAVWVDLGGVALPAATVERIWADDRRRIDELEASVEATRYAEAKAHDETLTKLDAAEHRIAELEAQAAAERRIANEHLVARHDTEKRIAELEADNRRLEASLKAGHVAYDKLANDHRALLGERDRAYADCREMRVALDLRAPDGSAAVNEAAKLIEERDTAIEQARYLVNAHARAADERDAAVRKVEEAEDRMRDLAESWRWIEYARDHIAVLAQQCRELAALHGRALDGRNAVKRDLEQARAALEEIMLEYEGETPRNGDVVCDRMAHIARAALSHVAPVPNKDEATCKRCDGTGGYCEACWANGMRPAPGHPLDALGMSHRNVPCPECAPAPSAADEEKPCPPTRHAAHRRTFDPHRATCAWRPEDDHDNLTGEACGKPATHISCQPYTNSPTCARHKCRCAKAIGLPTDAEAGKETTT